MGKKRKNPLSRARGQQNSHENVWFRRSGAGYRLFAEYYSNQPPGTVAEDKVEVTLKPSPSPQQRIGGSRAARRRRQKKQKVNGKSGTAQESLVTCSDFNEPQHPLMEAFKQSEKASPLLPFVLALSRPLPTTFRIRKTCKSDAPQRIKEDFAELCNSIFNNNNAIYQANTSKGQLSGEFKDFLFEYSQNGSLARQELGSMLPVMALEQVGALKQGSRVLDMCASPGSKTLQALEIIGSRGKIVANDILESRIDALIDAVKRSGMPTLDRIAFVCQDATEFETKKRFNAIICDVPCSGDGTIRKDKHILPMFKPNAGNVLHETQLKLLLRAFSLLKQGGVVCYSTCSLNPIEDEAVVSAALSKLNQHKNVARLEEWEPPQGLIRRPGLSTWKVADYVDDDGNDDDDPKLRWHENFQNASKDMEGALPSMWANEKGLVDLRQCMRLWPQDHDSGGFFVALVRKI